MSNYTEDLAEFGWTEKQEAGRLLQAYLPYGFYNEGVRVGFNKMSGYVFLVNDDYQCAMFNGDNVEIFHSTPYHSHEGFISDLIIELDPDDLNQEDIDYILQYAILESIDIPVSDKWFAHYLLAKNS